MPTEEGRLLPAGGKASRADKIYRPPSLPNAVLISRRAYKFAKVRAIFCTADVGKKKDHLLAAKIHSERTARRMLEEGLFSLFGFDPGTTTTMGPAVS